jgi:class 3 adenylate cyclase/putative methionine-R-sulfoxide reductase with GAF domain
MKRRSTAGGEAIKGRRPKMPKPIRRNAPNVQTRSKVSPATEETEVVRLTRELSEERKQRAATSEVLHLLSGSHGDLNSLFDTILSNATKLCQANFGTLSLYEGDAFRIVALHNPPPAYGEYRQREPLVRGRPLLHMAETKQLVHIADLREYVAANPADQDATTFAKLSGVRTVLIVPMLKDGEVVGAIVIYRQEVRTFNDREIELLKSFAAQAVIAIENARLLNELRQSLEQQTATAEVLQVVSSSLGDLEPVFATMLEKAVRICDATFGNIYRWDGEALHLVATHNTPPAFAEARRRSPHRRDGSNQLVTSILATKTPVHVVDAGEKDLVGVFAVNRQEVRPFTDKQIELVANFANQAVIAIENARLLNELRQRTSELETALDYQTATSDVLKVISRSVFDLQKILEFVAETAARLCATQQVGIFLLENDVYRFTVGFGYTPAYREIEERQAIKPGRETLVGRVALGGNTVHILDALSDPEYGPKDDIRIANLRTIFGVPLTREGKVVGVIVLARETVSSFSREQIDLVRTFADQAVIAIENARLLKELHERTEQVETQSQELVKLNQQLEERVADQVGEIERMSRLRRFLPPQVADLIVASGSEKQLESHRREITALFCDLRGFTGFSESADPEDVMTLLREYHEALGASIIKYSGTLERYAGDGVMVVFNDPVPVENPALQAVLMALEMRDGIGALTETWRRWGHEIGFGIGIAHGFATLGTIGFEGRFDYAAIGTVSNVASRLCDEAKPGQILISARVLTNVENAVKVEPVGEFELKGIRRPLAAYNVIAALASAYLFGTLARRSIAARSTK